MSIVCLQVHWFAWLVPIVSIPRIAPGIPLVFNQIDHPCDALFSENDHRPALPLRSITVASRIWIFPPYGSMPTLATYVLRTIGASIHPDWCLN